MPLRLDDEFIVDADKYSFHLQRLTQPDPNHWKTKEGAKPRLEHVAYCGTLAKAIQRYTQERIALKVRKEDVTPKDLLIELERVRIEVKEITKRLETQLHEQAMKAAGSVKRRGKRSAK